MWLAKVKETYGEKLQVDWRPFSLEQSNSKEGPEWKVWEQPNGLLALRAGEAAKRQGTKVFDDFLIALMKARHEDRKELTDPEVIDEAARSAGLDLGQFKEDLVDPDLLQGIVKSHTQAVEEYGVFGVPTFIFPNGFSAFLKTYQPPEEDAVEVFEAINKLMGSWNFIGELKRPQPPWPKGVVTSG